MAKDKEAVINTIEKKLKDGFGNNKSIKTVVDRLRKMPVREFEKLLKDSREYKQAVPIYASNMSDQEVDIDTILDACEKHNVPVRSRIINIDKETGEEYSPPQEFMILILPARRPIQHLQKERGFPLHTKSRDTLTNQVTGESKGASLSAPEVIILQHKGHEQALLELLKVRGGDEQAYVTMLDNVEKLGGFSLENIKELGSRPKITEVLVSLLRGAHIDNNL